MNVERFVGQTFVVCSEGNPDDPSQPYMYLQWGGGMEEMAHDFSLLRPADLWPSGFVSIRAFPPRSFAISAHPVSERWGQGAREHEERSLADTSRLVKADYHSQRH